MNGIGQCWYGLLLAVDRRDRDVTSILNLVCGTSSSMHVHHEPSSLGLGVLTTHDGWRSGTVGVADLALFFQCNVLKRKISLFREIELIWVKAVAIETVVSFIQSGCLWVPWEQSSADRNGGQPGCNWTSLNLKRCSLFRVTGPWPLRLHLWHFTDL